MPLAHYTFSETSPAAAGTAASSNAISAVAASYPAGVAAPLDDYDALDITAVLKGATGGTLDVYIQTSLDGGVTWTDSVHFPQLAAGASQVIYRTSITHLAQPTSAAPVVVGQGLNPALAVNVSVQGGWGDRARLVMVAGSGTSAGAVVSVTVAAQRPRVADGMLGR